MAVTVRTNRQWPIVATANHTYVDLVEAAVITTNAMLLPAQSVVIDGMLGVVTDYDDDASETFLMECGILLPLDRNGVVPSSSVDGDAGFGFSLVLPNARIFTAETQVTMTLLMSSGSSVLTAGESNLYVVYILAGRATTEQYK